MRQTDARLQCCIAITVNGNVYLYSNADSITLVDTARDKNKEWDGWEHFNKALSPQEIAMLAVNMGIRLQFKKGSKEDLSQEVWRELCYMAEDRRTANAQEIANKQRDPITGKKRGRKASDLGKRRYYIRLGPEYAKLKHPPGGDIKKELLYLCPATTRQANKIWEFFVDEYLNTGSLVVTEARMQNIVNDRAEELRTRQDPWRIFCYYRPELIDCQLIKLEK